MGACRLWAVARQPVETARSSVSMVPSSVCGTPNPIPSVYDSFLKHITTLFIKTGRVNMLYSHSIAVLIIMLVRDVNLLNRLVWYENQELLSLYTCSFTVFKGAICKNLAPLKFILMSSESLWLRGRASVLLLEGLWFDFSGLHVKVVKAKVSLGKILNLKLLLMCWLAPCVAATAISVWMHIWICMYVCNYCKLLWTKASAKRPE